MGLLVAVAIGAAGATQSAAAASNCSTSGATVTCTYTGAGEQTFTAPGGVTSLQVTATGGAGGRGMYVGRGGSGAQVTTTLAVNPGDTLYVEVGGNGDGGGAGGVGGGGSGGAGAGSGGGGASDVQTVHCTTASSCVASTKADLRVVAGGGGGEGPGSDGGNAGNSDGSGSAGSGDSFVPECAYPGLPCAGQGGGATTTVGGAGGGGEPADSDAGGAGGELPSDGNGAGGGGGGGGLYGGGGGGAHYTAGAGGGGSSYSAGTQTSFSTDTTGAPQVVIQYTQPTLTITANNQSMTHGGAVPALTASDSGFVNGDSASDLTTAPTCTTTATSHSPVGHYAITCSGAVDPNYSIRYGAGVLTIGQAALAITASSASTTYGGAIPAIAPGYSGFVNGGTAASLTNQPACGTAATSASPVAGSPYATNCAGAADPNYAISYAPGTLTVTKAALTVTADNEGMTYGGTLPALTASYSGFRNGDTTGVVTGALACATTALGGGPSGGGSTVGSYPITCNVSGLTAANYTFRAVPGTLTVAQAPLTITADNQTTPYGRVPAYTWTAAGFVNGESAATLAVAPNSAPICGATINGAAASATTPPGVYPGAITCGAAIDPNYAFTYVSGQLTVNPLLSLDEQGLPGTVPHRATLDGQTVALPDANVEVAFGSSHSYSFPATVTDGSGAVYITADGGFSGVVTANRSGTAVYQTMAQVINAALAADGIDNGGQANALTQQFNAVQQDIKAGATAQALADLHSFAAHVRAQFGKHIAPATARVLLTDAQLVYASLGGTGTV